jgi:putative sterol carrier protein
MQELGTIGPNDLLKMIEGRSDAEIISRFTELGVDSALDRVFQGMVEAFLPDRAGRDSAVIQWDLMTPDGPRVYQLVVKDGKCSWNRDELSKARVSLKIAVPDFLRLITGKLGGLQAFFQGKLKVGGDVLFAQQQEKWFQKPS